MINNDRQEKERVDARNALEEFVYDIRGKIQEGGELHIYLTETSRDKFCLELDQIETWLYEEGEDCERQVYIDRLSILNQQSEPIKNRHMEYENQAQAFEQLGHEIQMTRKAVDLYKKGDEKYNHLSEVEILNVSEAADKAEKFYMDAKAKLSKINPTEDPAVKVSEIMNESDTLNACARSVLSRAKPKPSTPPPSENTEPVESKQNGESNNNKKQQASTDKMDVE